MYKGFKLLSAYINTISHSVLPVQFLFQYGEEYEAQDYLVLLDEHGKELRSIEFATWIQKKQQTVRRLVFVIGGPYGFSPAVYQRCNEQLSLSKMTFSHQMVRMIFVEQLYRACTIIKGEPYHHE